MSINCMLEVVVAVIVVVVTAIALVAAIAVVVRVVVVAVECGYKIKKKKSRGLGFGRLTFCLRKWPMYTHWRGRKKLQRNEGMNMEKEGKVTKTHRG